MPKRVYISDVNELLKEGKKLIESEPNGKFIHKVGIVNLVLSGLPVSTISKHIGESVNTITLWVKKVDEQGFTSLLPKSHSGRPPKLDLKQREKIRTALLSPPENHGYRVWDGPALSNFIEKTFTVKMSTRQCQRLFHELGFSLQRPQVLPCKNPDSQERIEFKKTPIGRKRSKPC